MFTLQSVQGKNRLQNVHTKSSRYKMLGYEVMSCGYEMFVTKCPSYDMCGNPF